MMSDDFRCPKCNEPLDYDEVDVGVGVIRGNWGCPECWWTPKDDEVPYPEDGEIERRST